MLEEQQNHPPQNSFRVIYDMQNNLYLKVHKDLGTETLVYKDGSELKRFQPGLTGQLNSSRRFHHDKTLGSQTLESAGSRMTGTLQHESHFIVRRKLQPHNKMRTIDPREHQQPSHRQHKPHSLHTRSSEKDVKIMLPLVTQKDFFKKIVANREKELMMQYTQPTDQLSQTLKRFNELKQDSIYENHSIKKDIPGSSPKHSPDRVHLANQKYFDTLATESSASIEFSKSNLRNKTSVKRLNYLPETIKLDSQYLRERQLFFKVHPQSRPKTKEPDIMRRDNLKRLQHDFLQQTSRLTNRIYDHD